MLGAQPLVASGSLYTAQCATTFQKQVYALPGSIYDSLSEGSNHLIATGSSIYLPSQLKASITQSKCSHNHSTPLAKELCSLITHEGLTLDTLSQKLHLDLSSLHELIFQLELEGTIYQAGGLIHLS